MPHRAKQFEGITESVYAHRTETDVAKSNKRERFTDEFHWRFHDAG